MTTRTISRHRSSDAAANGAAPAAPCIAGIGAAAGGYEAIRNFFHAMPAASGIAFVVVQQLDPTHTSLAAELFAKCTAMPVSEASDGTLIEADHVYTSPSDQEVAVRNGRLRLTPRRDHQHLRLPIDHFFASLGEDQGARAIGIVLSGTGTDGTLGLKAIAAHGGIVLVQDPATAQFDGMPRSAIATGIANYVLPVEQMPEVLAGYVRHPYVEAAAATRQELAESHERRVRERTDKVRALSAALAMAEERERRALAQDLHDDLGQVLAVIKIKIGAMQKLKLSREQRQALDDCAGAVDQANRKLRTMAFQLSPPMLYELGLAAALEWLADEMRHVYKLDVRTEDDGAPKPLDPAVSATVFRAVRELLINVAKHAQVETATVTTVRGEGDMLIVTVCDAGTGFDPDALPAAGGSSGFGLLSVRERLGFLGGDVTILSNPGDGTSVVLRAPLLADGESPQERRP